MSLINTTGTHEVTVKSATFGESKTGTPFLELGFEAANGDTINGWLYLSTAAFENSVRRLREAFGFDNNFDTIEGQVVGKKCNVVTEFETYEGKERIKVKFINALRVVTPLSGGTTAISRFSAMAARVANEAPKAATKAPKADEAFPNV